MSPERIRQLIEDRRRLYETKRDQRDPFAPDDMNKHDAFALVVEAFDHLLADIGQDKSALD